MSMCLYEKIINDNMSVWNSKIVQIGIKNAVGIAIELGFTKLIKNNT